MSVISFRGQAVNDDEKNYQKILVKDYMTKDVITFLKSHYIFDVMRVMSEKKISGAPIISKRGKLVGIISESDIMKNIVDSQYYNMPVEKIRVSKYMTKSLDFVSPNNTIFETASNFLKLKRKRFPVLDSGKVVGIISRIDIINAALNIESQNW